MHARRGVALVVVLSCGGSAPPPKQEATIDPPACPQGSAWNGQLCQRTEPDPPPVPNAIASAVGATWNPPAPRPEDVALARQHFSRGAQLYSNGDYSGALAEFEMAYAYKQADPVLYNIAVTLEHLGRDDEALDVYQKYQSTNPPRAAEVQQKIDALKHKHP